MPQIVIVDYDPRWPSMFALEAEKIRAALGPRALRVEHVGSTSVPGLAAKLVIDVLLEVGDSAAEDAYAPRLETAGYALRIREPAWYEHRLFVAPHVNLHIFPAACEEIARMMKFRDWLRGNPSDRDLYANTKREMAKNDWTEVQKYADAKTAVIQEILTRSASPASTPAG